MKLLDKINRLYLFASAGLFVVGGLIFYFVLVGSIEDETEENLYKEKYSIIAKLKNQQQPMTAVIAIGQGIQLKKTNLKQAQKDKIETIEIYDEYEEEEFEYKKLTFYHKINTIVYEISISKSTEEYDDFESSITKAILLPLFMVLTLLYFLNKYYYSRNLWHPFYELLNKLKKFDPKKANLIVPENTGINEFDEFYQVAASLTQKIQSDYTNLKEFTENTSHELQTPLAIIKSKVELLIQDENLNEEQIAYIKSIYDTVGKMSKINDGLLLLAKLDNLQIIEETGFINLKSLIQEKLILFEDFILEKNISVSIKMDENFQLKMSIDLARLLLTNLISNAIKYNLPANGVIDIELKNNALTISNSGLNSDADLNQYFNRFKKSSINNNSIGLGMSIVKKICDIHKFSISYNYKNNLHCVSITFNS